MWLKIAVSIPAHAMSHAPLPPAAVRFDPRLEIANADLVLDLGLLDYRDGVTVRDAFCPIGISQCVQAPAAHALRSPALGGMTS